MPVTPIWRSAENGMPGDLESSNLPDYVNQQLGTHGFNQMYVGAQILRPTSGFSSFFWDKWGNAYDVDQPFVMPAGKTAIYRITVPILPVNKGADLLVSLYTDNGSGSPQVSNLQAQTQIPAEYILALSAPTGLSDAGPLAEARFNTMYSTVTNTYNWGAPAGTLTGAANSSFSCSDGNYVIIAGGVGSTTVTTTEYVGGGLVNPPIAQPPLPNATYSAAITTTDTAAVVIGGIVTAPSSGPTSDVWCASWNPDTGVIGTWSKQTSLPGVRDGGLAASYGNRVYYAGGLDGSATVQNTVWSASVDNGQIGAWRVENYLPRALTYGFMGVIGNWIIYAGGTPGGGVYSSTTYYAHIDPTSGVLGAWLTGPSLPFGIQNYNTGWGQVTADGVFTILQGDTNGLDTFGCRSLTATANTIGDAWTYSQLNSSFAAPTGIFDNGDNSWNAIALSVSTNQYVSIEFDCVPTISVPLVATGLTAGNTYHVVLQQHIKYSADDYLMYGFNYTALSKDAKYSPRYQNAWSTAYANYSMPIGFWDNTLSNTYIHFWEDPLVTGSAYSNKLAVRHAVMNYNRFALPTGRIEVTSKPNDPLNINPTFATSTAGWAPSNANCTFTQSSGAVHGGFVLSGLITPVGSPTSTTVLADKFPIVPVFPLFYDGQFLTVNGWLYSNLGVTNAGIALDWWDQNMAYLGTSSSGQALGVATWTNFVRYYSPLDYACYASLNVSQSGSPLSSSNLLYLSNVYVTWTPEITSTQVSAVQIKYEDPNAIWSPTSVVEI